MSLTASQILTAIAPQFNSDTNRGTHLQLAAFQTSSSCFGDKYNYAIALRAAHTLTLTSIQNGAGLGATGGVKQKKEGDVMISFGESSSSKTGGDLSQTSYGMQLQSLIDGTIGRVQITGLSVNCSDI